MRIGLLTSGGDCPGLNAVIRGAALKSSLVPGNEFVGFTYGWRGVVNADRVALRGTDIVPVSIAEATHKPKLVPGQRYEEAA